MKKQFLGLLFALTFHTCCLSTMEEELIDAPAPCTDTGYLLTVRGYYDLETCDIYYQLEDTQCGWTEDGLSVVPCPGLSAFQLTIDNRMVKLSSAWRLERSAHTLRVWSDESCPYPGDYDNGYAKEHVAVVLLTEEHWACIQGRGGFDFWFRVWV